MEKEALRTAIITHEKDDSCFHCGLPCDEKPISFDDKNFCCSGCQAVYSILKEKDLCTYYELPDARGNSPDRSFYTGKYAYLDLPEVHEKVVSFCEGGITQVRWYIPGMHCSSCVWLLENLYKLHPGVMAALVDFPEKTVRISIRNEEIRLSELAGLMASIGYEPYISLDDLAGKKKSKFDRTRIYKIGIAGFAFGNIMFMGFSDYFTINGSTGLGSSMQLIFGVLSIILALPVFFYCSSDFFVSAWKAIRNRQLNIDAPIALAILVTFLRSLVEISTQTGSGYLDSMTGIVFFMLVGRYFQDKSYALLSFDRDYKSFFPIAVSVLKDGEEGKLPISEVEAGDRLLIHSNEMIPCDGRLVSEIVSIDYSFVSGESIPVTKTINDNVYAGGRVMGAAVEIEATRKVAQSYLTTLWNNDVFTRSRDEEESRLATFINRYFTVLVFLIGSVSWVYWAFSGDFKRGFDAMTTVWIIACPCALLLSATFTNGNILRLLRKYGFYVKNAHVLERLSKIKAVVFDKTGTLTLPEVADVQFVGSALTTQEKLLVAHLARQSVHPLSRLVCLSLGREIHQNSVELTAGNFEERAGAGLAGTYGGVNLLLGSAKWVGAEKTVDQVNSSRVYLALDHHVKGYFEIRSEYREGLGEAVKSLSKSGFETYLLSGDKPTDLSLLTGIFGTSEKLNFSQTPQTKLNFVADLQKKYKEGVMMLGDGLNDAGALRQSDVGVAVSDSLNNFTPASDAILKGQRLRNIGGFIRLAKVGQNIVLGSFAISVIYNIIGLHFAIRGDLKPVVAAILMPASSISIILFTTLASTWKARQILRKNDVISPKTGILSP